MREFPGLSPEKDDSIDFAARGNRVGKLRARGKRCKAACSGVVPRPRRQVVCSAGWEGGSMSTEHSLARMMRVDTLPRMRRPMNELP